MHSVLETSAAFVVCLMSRAHALGQQFAGMGQRCRYCACRNWRAAWRKSAAARRKIRPVSWSAWPALRTVSRACSWSMTWPLSSKPAPALKMLLAVFHQDWAASIPALNVAKAASIPAVSLPSAYSSSMRS